MLNLSQEFGPVGGETKTIVILGRSRFLGDRSSNRKVSPFTADEETQTSVFAFQGREIKEELTLRKQAHRPHPVTLGKLSPSEATCFCC